MDDGNLMDGSQEWSDGTECLSDAFPELEAMYAALPEIPCNGCGLCCVTPEMTLVEFAYLATHMVRTWTPERCIAFLQAPMEKEPRYPGNFICRGQNEKNLCEPYAARPLICRIEGAPVLDRMGIRTFRNCPYITEEDMPEVLEPYHVDALLQAAFNLSSHFYGVYEEPYWLCALNLECWFAVALDPKITQPQVLAIRRLIRESVPMDFLVPHYRDKTELAKKLTLIELFFDEAEHRRPKQALRAIKRVLHDFPKTGAYYQNEAQKYTVLMQKIIRNQKEKEAE